MLGRRDKPSSVEDLPSRYPSLSGHSAEIKRTEADNAKRLRKAERDAQGGAQWPALVLLCLMVVCLVVALGFVFTSATKPVPEVPANLGKRPNQDAITAILDSAKVYVRESSLGKAETVLAQGVLEYPEDQELRRAYAEVLMMNEQYESAYHEFTEALRIGPRYSELEFTAGTMATKINAPDRAAAHFQSAQTMDPTKPEYPLFLAQAQLSMGELDKAASALVIASKLAPDNPIIYGTLAEIFLRKNSSRMALDQIAKARQLDPANMGWKVIEARALKRLGRADESLMVLASLPESVAKLRVECHGVLKQFDRAARTAQQASKEHPKDAELAYMAAYWSEQAGMIDDAKAFGERAVRLGHEAASALVDKLSATASVPEAPATPAGGG